MCDNDGIVDATERVKELERSVLSMDISPAVFREDVWDIKNVDACWFYRFGFCFKT